MGNKYIFHGPHTSSYTVYPGSAWYKDVNGDGFISTGSGTVDDSGDYHIIGNSTPPLPLRPLAQRFLERI